MIRLAIRNGERAGATFETDHVTAFARLRIGRDEHSELVVPDGHISSIHAAIVAREGRYILLDEKSTNGTAIVRNEQRIALDEACGREATLENGDIIELGIAEKAVHIHVMLTCDSESSRT